MMSNHYTQAFEILLNQMKIRIGDKLIFGANKSSEDLHAVVQKNGIEIDGVTHSLTSGACYLMKKQGYLHPVNGWLIWYTEAGRSLASLYRECVGIQGEDFDQRIAFKEYTHHFSPNRQALFFFGAGVSYSDGAPLQADLLKLVLNPANELIQSLEIQMELQDIIRENFYINEVDGVYPSLENIFSFFDYFILYNESLSRRYNNAKLHKLKHHLIKIIFMAVNDATSRSSENFDKFWKLIYSTSTNISIATLNYDTLPEDAFALLYPLNCYLDFCTELANYDYFKITSKYHWINPQSTILCNPNNPPFICKFIKLHGSLNWYYCNCCNNLLVQPWDRSKLFLFDNADTIDSLRCQYDGSEYSALITPPSYIKNLTHPIIESMLIEFTNEVRKADRLVFVGYSLPEADWHIKAILAKADMRNKKVVVINPFITDFIRRRFLGVCKDCEFVSLSFQDLVNDRELFQKIVAG